MRLDRLPLLVVCCAAILGVIGTACGGGTSRSKAPDSARIPTATLPATLPEPKIISGAAIAAGGSATYTIKSGDTLAGIASRFDVSLDDLRALNPAVDPSSLSVGQTIKLPQNTEPRPAATVPSQRRTPAPGTAAAEPTATSAPPETPTAAAATPTETAPAGTPTATSIGRSYVVEEGDFPAKIADKFGVAVEDLLAANPGINPTDLRIGQVIIIPPRRTP